MAEFEIICTIGPNSSDEAHWRSLVSAGATGFRVPFSKETAELQFKRGAKLESLFGNRIARYADIPGTVPRTQNESEVYLEPGILVVSADDSTPSDIVVSPFKPLTSLAPGTRVSFGDGEVEGAVRKATQSTLEILIESEGQVAPKRRFSWLRAGRSSRPLSKRDKGLVSDQRILAFTHIMASHVSTVEDQNELRHCIPSALQICTKIENRDAVSNIIDISNCTDQLIVGQGDLLIDAGRVDFGADLSQIFKLCKRKKINSPLFIGTQVFESLSQGKVNRAELGFLEAIIEFGFGGILLSAETTIGTTPYEVIDQIVQRTEAR